LVQVCKRTWFFWYELKCAIPDLAEGGLVEAYRALTAGAFLAAGPAGGACCLGPRRHGQCDSLRGQAVPLLLRRFLRRRRWCGTAQLAAPGAVPRLPRLGGVAHAVSEGRCCAAGGWGAGAGGGCGGRPGARSRPTSAGGCSGCRRHPWEEVAGPQVASPAEDVRRAAEARVAGRTRLAGARALPQRSTVTHHGAKAVFVVCWGSLAAGRPQAVIYGPQEQARYAVCKAAGNFDSGAVFHGFRTTSEAAAYWQAAAGGDGPWPVAPPAEVLAERH
jgi:hypothetical protein